MSESAARSIQKWRGRHDHLDRSGRLWRFKSTWELAYAKHLDALGLAWAYEPARLLLSTGRTYVPDFWVAEWATYVEVKSWSGSGGGIAKVEQAVQDGHPVRLMGKPEMLPLLAIRNGQP